jgi:hypothetical protein
LFVAHVALNITISPGAVLIPAEPATEAVTLVLSSGVVPLLTTLIVVGFAATVIPLAA